MGVMMGSLNCITWEKINTISLIDENRENSLLESYSINVRSLPKGA